MALISCLECEKEISEQANNCPNCGFPINKEQLQKPLLRNNKFIPSVILVSIIDIMGCIILYVSNLPNKKLERNDFNIDKVNQALKEHWK